MTPCLSQATTINASFLDDVEAFSRAGWPSFEIWLTKLEKALEVHTIEAVRTRIQDSGMVPIAAAVQGGLIGAEASARALHRAHFERRLEWLQKLGVQTLVIVPDFVSKPDADNLGKLFADLFEAAELAARYQVRLALEFQKSAPFCASMDTAAAVVHQVGAANLGLCLDLFHYYTGPSKFEDLGLLDANMLYHVHISDLSGVPRELATDADRILPGDGDFQVAPILDQLSRIGYTGAISVEVLNPALWQIPVDRVAAVAWQALGRLLDPFCVTEHAGGV